MCVVEDPLRFLRSINLAEDRTPELCDLARDGGQLSGHGLRYVEMGDDSPSL